MAVTVQVAVDNATFHFDKQYTYVVPAHLQAVVFVGSMVLIPFGRGKSARMGVVLQVDNAVSDAKVVLKSIYDCAPEAAVLTKDLLDIVYYLKEQTFCTYYDAVKAVIPYGAQYKAIETAAGFKLQKQVVRHTQNIYEIANLDAKLTDKQAKAYELIKSGCQTQSQLENMGISKDVLARMCKNEILKQSKADKELEIYTDKIAPKEEIVLSQEQENVYLKLSEDIKRGQYKKALLYGVTSSGKTLVFLKLIETALSLNKKALVLVPEISLTPQMIYRLKSYFGKRVAVQHSALNNTERLLQWQQIQNGNADIVVGTRSAVFAPLKNLGVIIIDEEQEHTYHSDSSPRYDARDIAKKRATSASALLLLASATPSVETFYDAQVKKIELCTLKNRFNNLPLPHVKLCDMREETANGNTGSISRLLAQEIKLNLQNKNQTILLLNRRGYKTVGMCAKCDEVIKCSACSVPMVYHKAQDKLMCHYCGKSIHPVPQICPNSDCKGQVHYTGFGTQRVEEELQTLFPSARVLRMDLDTTSHKNAHEKMLKRFANKEYDIMLGTQMVAKGLDFEKVTLVGVLGIDQMLFAQGFKAYENVFSLVTQVVGRGGRASQPGRAIIQTVDINNPVLNLAAHQDYLGFYNDEIQFRKINLYPPFCTICMAGFSGKNENNTLQAASEFAKILKGEALQNSRMPLRILGPAPMGIFMVNNTFRFKLTIKCKNNKAFREVLGKTLVQYNSLGFTEKASVYVNFYSDADI